ncbi:single-stranded DNA-binding protein [Solicola sp. PLA-1-18]|uniref:single-stranded DNA-binding protein n=1 Tax=Solicola sp. PLA-1-18 TaxID=3380532 RepID=UPI003B7F45E6
MTLRVTPAHLVIGMGGLHREPEEKRSRRRRRALRQHPCAGDRLEADDETPTGDKHLPEHHRHEEHTMTLNTVTIHPNLAADPQLQFTPNGTAVTTAVVLANRRVRVPGTDDHWRDATPTRHRAKAWRRLAENLATLTAGTQLVVVWHARTDTYERDGQTRYADTVVADVVGASLAHATVDVTKNPRPSTGRDDLAASA